VAALDGVMIAMHRDMLRGALRYLRSMEWGMLARFVIAVFVIAIVLRLLGI
jgi:hypothetical protein